MQKCQTSVKGGGRGFCRTHYVHFYQGRIAEDGTTIREPFRVATYGEGVHCSVEGCTTRPRINGLCNRHYLQWKDGRLPADAMKEPPAASYVACKLENCTVRASSRGMCPKHARQVKAGIINELGEELRDPSLRPGRGWRSYCRGYVKVMAKNHPQADRDGYVLEHRLVMEKILGRFLERHEVVHHRDGVRNNNTPENLEVHTRKTHPPAHEYTVETTRVALQALRVNDPQGLALLLREFLA